MVGFGKKKEPQRWGGKYAIRKTTSNNGKVRWETVRKENLPLGGHYWWSIWTHDTCKEAEAWLDGVWAEKAAKTEILTSCEECE